MCARNAALTSWPHNSPARLHDNSDSRNHSSSASTAARTPSAPMGNQAIRVPQRISPNSVVR